MNPIDFTYLNSLEIYNSLPATSEDVTWNAGVLTEEEFRAKEAELELLENIALYNGDGVIVVATFEALIKNKNYTRLSVLDMGSILLYHYLYIYTS